MFKFKFEKNYQPKQFTESEPEVTTEAAAETSPAPVEAAAKPSLFARGHERLQKSGEALRALRTRTGDFFKKIGEKTSAWGRGAVVGVLAAPELASAAGSAAMGAAERGSAAYLKGWNAVGEGMQNGVDSAIDAAMDSASFLKEYGTKKKVQFDAFTAKAAEDAQALAGMASNYVAETAAATSESVRNGLRNMAQWGASALAYAEARRMEAVQEFRTKMDEERVAKLQLQVEAGERAKSDLEAMRGKLDLRNELSEAPELAVAA